MMPKLRTTPNDQPRRLKVCHIITGLPRGGAQTTLYNLLDRHDTDKFQMDVISLTETGPVGEMIQGLGIPVRALNINRKWPNPLALLKLAGWLARDRPDVVQTWMYHSDLVGGIAARLTGRRTIWNIRQSDLDPKTSKWATIMTAKACAAVSWFVPHRIVCCSQASRIVHHALGYDDGRMLVIGNGIDLKQFRPDHDARLDIRRQLGIGDDALLIGLIARFHPQKDHRSFVTAAAELVRQRPDAHFLLCGEDITEANAELMGWIEEAGIAANCHLLGERGDVPKINAALDLSLSTSAYGEGFSNVLIEAMACGVPCVTTDVGDSALIVGDLDQVVSPRDPHGLAGAIGAILDLSGEQRRALGAQCRGRIETEFQLSTVIERYQNLYRNTAEADSQQST
jgi:glycosyltransferase involved in cell wall biosynthesis